MSAPTGQDEKISGAKIDPLSSEAKVGVPHDDAGGVTGTDAKIDRSRMEPVGGAGQYQNPAPHADTQGSVGHEANIQEAKIEPLKGPLSAEKGTGGHGGTYKGDVGDTTGARTTDTQPGYDEEVVDKARVDPLGSVREEQKP